VIGDFQSSLQFLPWMSIPFLDFHPPTQETMALAVEEYVDARNTIPAINLHASADDPSKPPPAIVLASL
jgi:hypothetical protein